MKVNSAEVGERYGDDSGWAKRVAIDLQAGKLEIDMEGSYLSAHPRDLEWLIAALQRVRDVVSPHLAPYHNVLS